MPKRENSNHTHMSDKLFKKAKNIIKPLIPYSMGVKLRGGWQKFMGWYYVGSKYSCPYCGKSFRKMLPAGHDLKVNIEKHIIGAGFRTQVLCPRCYSTDRDRLIYIWLNEETDVATKPVELLHIAPEGSIRAFLSKQEKLSYHMGDKYESGYDQYYYDRKVHQMDITAIPFEENSFDYIICNHVLEHILDDQLAMIELYRVLKPGGKALLQVPISWLLPETYEDASINTNKGREEAFGQFDHVRIYGSDYPQRLKNAGFIVDVIDPETKGWLEKHQSYSLNPEEKLFIAEKA